MTAKSEWLELKQRSMVMSQEAQIEPFCAWTETFVLEEKGRTGAFDKWLEVPEGMRKKMLRQLIAGEIVCFGDGPQVEGVFLASLFHVLTFGRCLIMNMMRVDAALVRNIGRSIEGILDEPLTHVGSFCGVSSQLKFNDIGKCKLAICDYYMFATAMNSTPDLFEEGLPMLFLEIDSILYSNRLIFYDRGIPQSSGMIYNTNEKLIPLWRGNRSIYDVSEGLRQRKILIGGSSSYMNKQSAEQLNKQYPYLIAKPVVPNYRLKYSAFAFKTSDERIAALLSDIMKTPDDAIVFCNDDEICNKLMEELRKSGQDYVLVRDTEEMVTALASGSGKHVVLEIKMTSTMFSPPLEKHPATLFVADPFLSEISYTKMNAAVNRMAIMKHDMRIYFSLEDSLIKLYEEQGGFARFFSLMDFTEKYDPWRQIRRVLAKTLLNRLASMRKQVMNDNMPLPVVSLRDRQTSDTANRPARSAAKVHKMVDGLCFCGSGKPFKECHGKPRN
ncbi:MAG: SEC-C domain-containing protein [Victivallales bacterium]|nr:SEC-C domain-containing protein [Victivallales bacterium]